MRTFKVWHGPHRDDYRVIEGVSRISFEPGHVVFWDSTGRIITGIRNGNVHGLIEVVG